LAGAHEAAVVIDRRSLVMRSRLVVLALCVATAGVAVAAATACGDGATNLSVPVGMRTELRAVFLRAHPGVRAADVAGPLPGRTYYGTNGDFHAVAAFQVAGHPARPSVFWKLGNRGSSWRFVRDTHGGIRETDVSPDLLLLWGFTQWRHGPYYLPPR
jgi:hypothetical protein